MQIEVSCELADHGTAAQDKVCLLPSPEEGGHEMARPSARSDGIPRWRCSGCLGAISHAAARQLGNTQQRGRDLSQHDHRIVVHIAMERVQQGSEHGITAVGH